MRTLALAYLAACSTHHATTPPSSDASFDASSPADAAICTTRISYGSAWIAPANHPNDYDDVTGPVTWDGSCTDDASGNSYAMLSNGFTPYFTGPSACVLALDESAACADSATCTTRITYGSGWLAPANHPNDYDDVAGRVFGDGTCVGGSYANLSNGFQPHFSGGACPLSFEYTQCGGLYTNPVIPTDCPDPGVLLDGDHYVLSCTSGDSAAAFPIYTSPDLATWTQVGHIFPSGMRPAWAVSDFWAPEIHRIGSGYVAYFSARGSDGMLAIGAASAPTATGPFTDIGAPLVHSTTVGLIDASEFTDDDGALYALWKEDGNANDMPTPIHSQPLAPTGLTLAGSPATLITNDQAWEGAVTEGPWMIKRDGTYYLFYSGNSYANATYAVGIARGSSPSAAMTKPADPILVTDGAWVGPGHCSVLDTPDGVTAMIFHAWTAGCVNTTGCGRHVLVDEVMWGSDGWPTVPLAPSSTTRPLP